MKLLGELAFFLLSGGVFSLLIWSTLEFLRNDENPLDDRLEDLGSQAMVATARTTRFKTENTGLGRFLHIVSLVVAPKIGCATQTPAAPRRVPPRPRSAST